MSFFKKNNGRAALAALFTGPLDIVSRFSLYASSAALFLMLSTYLYEVVVRYFFNSPTSWSNDVIQLFFAAMIMLALPEITRMKGHIAITFFLEKMSRPAVRRTGRVLASAGCVMCLAAAFICWQESIRQYHQGIQTLWNHPIPKWWISFLIPYGFTLSGLQMLRTSLFWEEN